MKYWIQRASGSDTEDGRPCKDAILETMWVEKMETQPPPMFGTKVRALEKTEGSTTDGSIPCWKYEMEVQRWMIEFTTLEELEEFIDREGEVVVYPSGTILIYDDYIE